MPKAYPYARDFSATRGLAPHEKFVELYKLLEEAEAESIPDEMGVIMVTDPSVLGDDYDELVSNLCFIAQAGLFVAISPEGATELLERCEKLPPSG